MINYNFEENFEIAYCLTPFHFLQFFLLHKMGIKSYIITNNSIEMSLLFEKFRDFIFIPIDERKIFYQKLKKYLLLKNFKVSIDYYYSTPWNLTALKLESIIQKCKNGKVHLLEDGLGNYIENYQINPQKNFRDYILKMYFKINGLDYCVSHFEKYKLSIKKNINLNFYSILPNKYFGSCKANLITKENLKYLNELKTHYKNLLKENKIKSVFFDTNDAEHGWIDIETKINILKNIFTEETLYLPHPFQKFKLSKYIENLIEVENLKLKFNELLVYFLEPEKVYSVFSTSLITLKYLFNMNAEYVLLADIFYKKTKNKKYLIGAEELKKLIYGEYETL